MRIRLASYNLHKCRGSFGPFAPERNLDVIAELGADIVALQEVDFRMGDRPEALPRQLIQARTGLVPMQHRRTSDQSLGWHGQTILLRPELAAVARSRPVALPGIEPRGAVALHLPGLTVMAVHLGLMRSSRRAQLARLAAKAGRLDGGSVVLTGDFNEWHGERGLEALTDLDVIAPGRSWPALAPQLRLDRIAVSPGVTVAASGVLDTPLARMASDHLPIWADLHVTRPALPDDRPLRAADNVSDYNRALVAQTAADGVPPGRASG
ncbi:MULTISPECIES: endonuclease/exonuclease/phosphatase family protein [Paracoccus]|uniref:Endonuclease n=1 Tax=Paracoccus solventivorans TaxID=53463 RepID=A0A832PPL9_9RHOB|nr:endonuclease/exonuclease/phosphatase family protein [Paracoccus solventivorans]HHW34791.1 endonuclease [Paracoccus solventivorans]HMM07600.1 endonuclease/exonuclease/phosphatase family protein [Paracoccus solventivorans]